MNYPEAKSEQTWGQEDNVLSSRTYLPFRLPNWTSTRSISETDIFTQRGMVFPEVQRGIVFPEDDKENDPLDIQISPVKLSRNTQPNLGFHKLLSNLKLEPITDNLGPSKDEQHGRLLRAETAPPMVGRVCLSASNGLPDIEKARLKEEAKSIRTKLSPRRKPHLDILSNTSQPELNCLSYDMVAKLVMGAFNHFYDKILIIDCRFDYEYNAGHITGALNFPQTEDLVRFLIEDPCYHCLGEKLCVVYHCEFSSHRAPKAYNKIRSMDRKRNEHQYPKLFYPEMYLLEGGYKEFWKQKSELCEPHGYVEMRDPSHICEMRLAMRNLSRSKSQKRITSRSCSNIFLEMDRSFTGTTDMEEVPTTPIRTKYH